MTVVDRIRQIVAHSNYGRIFFANSFENIDEEYAGKVLSDLCKDNRLIRISQGIYLKPIMSSFGPVYPTPFEIVEAISKRDKVQILPTGAMALNMLGMSTQVPMNSIFITSGSARCINIGNRTIKLKRSVPKNFMYKGSVMPILVQAIKAIGKENINEFYEAEIKRVLKENPEEKTWNDDIQLVSLWIRRIIVKLKDEIQHE